MKRICMLLVVMLFGVNLVGCDNYECRKDDFECTISVNESNVSVDDFIKVTITLKNVSGRNIRIEMNHTDYEFLEDMIVIGVFIEGEDHYFNVNSKNGPKKKTMFLKNEIVIKELSFKIDNIGNYEVQSSIAFCTGKNYNQQISILSDIKKIIVEE